MESEELCSLKNRFSVEDMDCSLVNNLWISAIQLGCLSLLKFVLEKKLNKRSKVSSKKSKTNMLNPNDLSELDNLTKKEKTSQSEKSTGEKIREYLNTAFFVYFFNSLLLDIMMAVFLSFAFSKLSEALNIV